MSKLEKEISKALEGACSVEAGGFAGELDPSYAEDVKKLVLKYMRRAYNAGKNPPTTLGRPAQENFSAYVKRIKL